MKKAWREYLKMSILFLLAGFFIQKYLSGNLFDYISPRFAWLAVLGAVLFAVMAISFINSKPDHYEEDLHHEDDHPHEHNVTKWPVILVSVPLVLGIFVPSRPLGASQVANQGISTDISAPSADLQTSLKIIPAQRNVLDWVRAIGANPDPAAMNEQQVDVIGFVYRDVRFTNDQFMVARYAISCCVADARAMGLVVQTDAASQYATGVWVRVQGHFIAGALDNNPMPVIKVDSIVSVDQPAQPYLYP
jgi:putative membrane protein